MYDRLAERLPGTIVDTRSFATLPLFPFERLHLPSLVVHGLSDSVTPFAHAQAAADGVAGSRRLDLQGGDHVAPFTHLDEIRAAFLAFTATL